MKHTIEWYEKIETGKLRAKVTLKDLTGAVVTNATIWGDFPGFADLGPGSVVEGDLVPAKDPQYGPTLYPPRPQNAPNKGGFSGAGGAKLMAQKAEGIAKSQDRKEEGIKHSSVMRMAHETSLAEFETLKNGPDGELEIFDSTFPTLFAKWQKWYGERWELPF